MAPLIIPPFLSSPAPSVGSPTEPIITEKPKKLWEKVIDKPTLLDSSLQLMAFLPAIHKSVASDGHENIFDGCEGLERGDSCGLCVHVGWDRFYRDGGKEKQRGGGREGGSEGRIQGGRESTREGSSRGSREGERNGEVERGHEEDGVCVVLDGVLSKSECESLIQQTEKLGYSFWDSTSDKPESDFRSANTIEVMQQELADIIWSRVRDHVVPEVTIGGEEKDGRWELELEGTWQPIGINPNLLFARYTEGGHFGPHSDGCTVVDINTRSLYPVVLYLNTPLVGGETLVLDDQQKCREIRKDQKGRYHCDDSSLVIYSTEAKAGRLLSFYYTQMHEGAPVGDGSLKYIIRTDVMYQRKIPILTSVSDKEAFQLWLAAQERSEKGELDEALVMFKRAFRLSDGLKDLLRM
eukprot:GHVQ01039998.1.p1 GENE.GHVQ01039998.1~~GHVQ01039998.1.p1  ORF type:complete len:410 (+),score=61.97 GHVQ01039998.1:271-1500(+)